MYERLFQAIDGSKVTPVGEIPADMLKVTLDAHLKLTTKVLNLSFENWCFPDDLKLSEVRPTFQKRTQKRKEANKQTKKQETKTIIKIKKTIGSSVFYLMFQRYLKESFAPKLMCSCKANCQTYWQVLEKNIVHSIVWSTCLKFGKKIMDKGYVCMSNVHCFIKGFWHNTPRFIDSQVRSVWFSTGCSSVHEKLCN